MALKDELGDPWGLLVAAVVGGCAWAIGIPVVAAAGVGAAVLGVKAAAGSVLGRGPRRPAGSPARRVRSGSPEDRWLSRAERAVRSFRRLAESAADGPVADRCRSVGEQAESALETMRRLAGQTSAVTGALEHVDAARLIAEEHQLEKRLRDAPTSDEVTAEIKRSLESVQAQLAVHKRLAQAGRALLARMESGALGLEGLVARLAEITAMTATNDPQASGAGGVDALADELDGLRAGLAETEDLSRRALTAWRETA
jgi:hypothetical protein